jgi:hypothetical protein
VSTGASWAQRTYGFSTGSTHGVDLTVNVVDEHVITGYTNSIGAGGWDIYMLQVDDVTGNCLNSRTYGTTADEYANSLYFNGIENVYFITGYQYLNDIYNTIKSHHVSVEYDLTEVWTVNDGAIGYTRNPWLGIPYYDIYDIVGEGNQPVSAGGLDGYLTYRDINGTLLSHKKYGGTYDDGFYSITRIGGNFAMLGYTYSYETDKTPSSGTNAHVYLVIEPNPYYQSPTVTPTITVTPTFTITHTITKTVTQTVTETVTQTVTKTVTQTVTPTVTQTATPTFTVTKTATPTITNTVTKTVTQTVTETITKTVTKTITQTVTQTVTQTATKTVTPTVTPTFTITKTHPPTRTASPTRTVTKTSTITPTATETHIPEFRVNCGNGGYTDVSSKYWYPDQAYTIGSWGYTSGGTDSVSFNINGTVDKKLYQTNRNGDFSYLFDTGNGYYQVFLKFAEIYYSNIGDRVFNVAIEGTPVLTNFDVYSQVGGYYALDKTFIVNLTDGQLNIDFASVVNGAFVSAIEVKWVGLTLPTATVTRTVTYTKTSTRTNYYTDKNNDSNNN